MPIITYTAPLAGVMRLLDRGGAPTRAELIQVMIDGHMAGAQLTDLDSEPVNWTALGRAVLANDEAERETRARLGGAAV